MITKRAIFPALVAFGIGLNIGHATAESYPNRTIKIISSGVGGPADVAARLVAQRLQTTIGWTVIIENRGGAAMIAAKAAAGAEPDGYTLLAANTSMLATLPAVSKKLGYDPSKDFASVASLSQAHQVLVVHPSIAARTVQELVAYAKDNPGKLNYAASGGPGALPHLAGALFESRAGISTVPVFYKSGADALTAVIGGQVHMTFENISTALPLIQEGKLRGLAVTSEARNSLAPELPTMLEAGVPDCVVTTFVGVVAPAGTPPHIINKLNAAINDNIGSPEMQASLTKLGMEPKIASPQEFAAFIVAQTQQWASVAASAGIRLD